MRINSFRTLKVDVQQLNSLRTLEVFYIAVLDFNVLPRSWGELGTVNIK